ncbi:hypothetical protein [Solidesulfovibrio sp.]|uniref:hypothetical protein n=1 Tax=Solidesulfovibrio sp. TaxID=2910990 RepID=UPI0038B603DD
MEPLDGKTCCAKEAVAGSAIRNGKLVRYLLLLAPALAVWWLAYGAARLVAGDDL